MKEFVKYAFLMSVLFPVFSCERMDMPPKPEISISIDVPEIGQTFANAVFEAERYRDILLRDYPRVDVCR